MQIELRPNLLTKEENDYSAVVNHQGKTLQIADIARMIIRDGSENDEYTIVDLFRKMERKIIQQLALGKKVDTDLYHAMATVSGVFKGKAAHFDPTQGHAIGIALNICPPALAYIAESVDVVEVKGVLQVGPEIGTVEDMYTHSPIGTQTRALITPQRTLRVKGKHLRVAWDNEGTHPTDCGIFLVKTTDPLARTRVPNQELITNLPAELLFTIPALQEGFYWLEIVTQSSGNAATLIKEPRTTRFEIALEVENE